MGCVISAHNDSSQQSERISAARILQGLPTHFQAVSGPSNRSDEARVRHYVAGRDGAVHSSQFLVSDECFRRLMENVQLSRTTAIATSTSSTASGSGRGCALTAVGGIVTLVVLALAVDAGSGPSVSSPDARAGTGPLDYRIPPVAEGRVLSMPELRWCVREDRRIERERLVPATSQADVDRFNSRVDNYNSRCSDFRYRPGDLERARREVGSGSR